MGKGKIIINLVFNKQGSRDFNFKIIRQLVSL